MRTLIPALAIMAVVGCCAEASAQSQCPELARLRSEATEASRPKVRSISNDCEGYIRSSWAWSALLHYAADHRQACDISDSTMSDFERFHRAEVTARNNMCAGRPVRPFPVDIIRR
jgi:hypothetical protein